jgi:hypothetical protein
MSIREAHDGEADAVVDMFIWKYTFDVSSGVQDTESSNCRALFVQVQKGPTLWCYVWRNFQRATCTPEVPTCVPMKLTLTPTLVSMISE